MVMTTRSGFTRGGRWRTAYHSSASRTCAGTVATTPRRVKSDYIRRTSWQCGFGIADGTSMAHTNVKTPPNAEK